MFFQVFLGFLFSTGPFWWALPIKKSEGRAGYPCAVGLAPQNSLGIVHAAARREICARAFSNRLHSTRFPPPFPDSLLTTLRPYYYNEATVKKGRGIASPLPVAQQAVISLALTDQVQGRVTSAAFSILSLTAREAMRSCTFSRLSQASSYRQEDSKPKHTAVNRSYPITSFSHFPRPGIPCTCCISPFYINLGLSSSVS